MASAPKSISVAKKQRKWCRQGQFQVAQPGIGRRVLTARSTKINNRHATLWLEVSWKRQQKQSRIQESPTYLQNSQYVQSCFDLQLCICYCTAHVIQAALARRAICPVCVAPIDGLSRSEQWHWESMGFPCGISMCFGIILALSN